MRSKMHVTNIPEGQLNEKCKMSLNQNVIFFMRKYFNNLHIDQCLAQLYGFV